MFATILKALQDESSDIRIKLQDVTTGEAFEAFFERIFAERGATVKSSAFFGSKCITNWLKNSKNGIFLNDSDYDNVIIPQPRGSQQFPDFLVLEGSHGYVVELKSTKKKPMPFWNSGVKDGIYIFYNMQDLTFFLGSDIMPDELKIMLNKYHAQLRDTVNTINASLSTSKYNTSGIRLYYRKTETQKDYDFFANTDSRQRLERNVFRTIQKRHISN